MARLFVAVWPSAEIVADLLLRFDEDVNVAARKCGCSGGSGSSRCWPFGWPTTLCGTLFGALLDSSCCSDCLGEPSCQLFADSESLGTSRRISLRMSSSVMGRSP